MYHKLFLLFVLIFIACGTKKTTVEIIDGVKHVHNRAPLLGDESKVKLEFVQSIGELEGYDENLLLFRPSDVAQDQEGNIYILDSGNFRVQKFNSKGDFIQSIGRRGPGPGEFQNIRSMDIDSDGNIYVNDVGSTRMQVFSTDGKLQNTILMENRVLDFRVLNNNNIVAWFGFTQKWEGKNPPLIAIYDLNGNLIKTFGESKDFGHPSVNFDGNTFVSTVSKNDEIYISFIGQNRIEKYTSNGNLQFRADRRLNYDFNPKIEKFNLAGEEVSAKIPPKISLGIGVDSKNRLWVATFGEQKENPMEMLDNIYFEMYNENGHLLETIPINVKFMSFRVFNNNIYLIDVFEEMCVYVYKIVD